MKGLRLALTAMAVGLTLVGAADARAEAARRSGAHVYFLRGFMNVFSLGLDQMAEKVRERGIEASVHSYTEWSSIAQSVAETHRNGRGGPVIFVGHSMGASAAINAAEQLAAANVPVQLIVTLDPVAQTASPRNVRRVVNLYFPNGMGAPIKRGARGSVENVRLAETADFGHFSMDKVPQIQKRVLSLVYGASGSRRRPGQ